MTIGILGCLPEMPLGYPVQHPENAGNMVHANAPFYMFDDCVFYKNNRVSSSGDNFPDFLNKNCSHLILTFANTRRLNDSNGEKYKRILELLSKVDDRVKVVVFGLGAQASSGELSQDDFLPLEAIELMKYISARSPAIGVRGHFTKKVLENLCGVDNAYVTGCPSLYSRPEKLSELQNNLYKGKIRFCERRGVAYSGTRLFESNEKAMLYEAVKSSSYLIEPVNAKNHSYYLSVARGEDEVEVPYFFRGLLKQEEGFTEQDLKNYFMGRYKNFKTLREWYSFNEEVIGFTYGTRFHVNMASILCGIPALWVTHDSRTQELADYLRLPSLPLEVASSLTAGELLGKVDYNNFFNNIDNLFCRFNEYLAMFSLKQVNYPAFA